MLNAPFPRSERRRAFALLDVCSNDDAVHRPINERMFDISTQIRSYYGMFTHVLMSLTIAQLEIPGRTP